MMKYHPFREHKLHKNDASIIFGSAVFLIINLGIMQYVKFAINTIEKTADSIEKTVSTNIEKTADSIEKTADSIEKTVSNNIRFQI